MGNERLRALHTGVGPTRVAATTAVDFTAICPIPNTATPARFLILHTAGRIVGTDEYGNAYDSVENLPAGYFMGGMRTLTAATTCAVTAFW